MKLSQYLLFIFLIFIFPILSFGQMDIDLDGYFSSGFYGNYLDDFLLFSKMKLEVELEITESVKIEIDIEGDTENETLEFDGGHALFKSETGLRFKIGLIKKIIGLEKINSIEDLVTVEKSRIYRYIAPFSYNSTEPGVMCYHKGFSVNENINLFWNLGAYFNNTYTATINGRVGLEIPAKDLSIGLNGVFLHYSANFYDYGMGHPTNSYALSGDCVLNKENLYFDTEMFIGMDPFETQIRKQLQGIDETVLFSGIKSTFAYFFPFEGVIFGLEPFIMVDFLAVDFSSIEGNFAECMPGLNIYFVNRDIRLQMNGIVVYERTFEAWDIFPDTGGIIQFQVKW